MTIKEEDMLEDLLVVLQRILWFRMRWAFEWTYMGEEPYLCIDNILKQIR